VFSCLEKGGGDMPQNFPFPLTVGATVAAVYERPDASSKRADELPLGWGVTALSSEGGFYGIRTQYGYKGYVAAADLSDFGPAPRGAVRRTIARLFGDVVAYPNIKSPVASSLPMGAALWCLGGEDGFTRVSGERGLGGYVADTSLGGDAYSPVGDPDDFRSRVVKTASMFLGAPYRWGGKTGMGVDCSGLCFMAYYMNGCVICRDARMDPSFPVRSVPLDEARMGDLLYFPGHVAMYLGEGNFIHSSVRNGGVALNSLYPESGFYAPNLAESLIVSGTIF
jgi:cell wall-associated NlpC family hydrolase